jgi:hypothetical protein
METNNKKEIEISIKRPSIILIVFASVFAISVTRLFLILIFKETNTENLRVGLIVSIIGVPYLIWYVFFILNQIYRKLNISVEDDLWKIRFKLKKYNIPIKDIKTIEIANNSFNSSYKNEILSDYEFIIQKNVKNLSGSDFGIIMTVILKDNRKLRFKWIEEYELIQIERFISDFKK